MDVFSEWFSWVAATYLSAVCGVVSTVDLFVQSVALEVKADEIEAGSCY